ncbi:MAG: response regulator [Desulfobacteraceae bacterium]|jgi:DNA-binding NtrC family response regulator|nr:response regulator [Desulfobacteraceae bacterium]
MKTRVLLVDDERDFLDIMAERIRARGMAVTTATSAEEAAKMVKMGSYDTVIMDFMMPAMDGLKALKLLKDIQPEIQVILLTGDATADKCSEALRLGALDVIEKPADLNLLIQKIKDAKDRKQKNSKKKL